MGTSGEKLLMRVLLAVHLSVFVVRRLVRVVLAFHSTSMATSPQCCQQNVEDVK